MDRRKMAIVLLLMVAGVAGRLTLSELLPPSPEIYININGITPVSYTHLTLPTN